MLANGKTMSTTKVAFQMLYFVSSIGAGIASIEVQIIELVTRGADASSMVFKKKKASWQE